jgi:chromosomal replication initiation ATPase DnaA
MLLTYPFTSPASLRRSRTSARRICHDIARLVAEEFEIDAAAMISPTRGAPHAAYARQVAMYLAHVGFALSFEAIGRAFDRDRTTVSHACRVVEDSRDDAGLDRRLAALEAMCTVCGERLDGTSNDGI